MEGRIGCNRTKPAQDAVDELRALCGGGECTAGGGAPHLVPGAGVQRVHAPVVRATIDQPIGHGGQLSLLV